MAAGPGEQEFAADADADTYAGPAPLRVRFTTRTINPRGRVRYLWNFDDGSLAGTEQNPTHTFRKPGWYLVVVDATDAARQTYRLNLQLHAWRPKDWERLQKTRDLRIAAHGVLELQRKRARAEGRPVPDRLELPKLPPATGQR